MLKIFGGTERARAELAVKKVLGDDYETIEADNLSLQDMASVFLGTSLFGEERRILLKGLDENRECWRELPRYVDTPHRVVIWNEKPPDRRSEPGKSLAANSAVEIRSFDREISKDEKYAAWDYTNGSGKFNRPTRGYNGGWSKSQFKGVGNVPLDNEGGEKEIIELTNLLDKSFLPQDVWLNRGIESWDGVESFFGIPQNVLQQATQEELEEMLVGKVFYDPGFWSCGSSKGTGFSGAAKANIFCPQGSKGLYVEPFSYYGKKPDGYGINREEGLNWDGITNQTTFSTEFETILQRNGGYLITKVEKLPGGSFFFDCDLVDQRPWDVKY